MRFLLVIPSITNYFTFLEGLTNTLTARGHEVHLATSRRHIAPINAYRRKVHCHVHDIRFPRAIAPLAHYRAARQVHQLIQKINPHLVNVHFSAALFTTMLLKDHTWPPTTGTIHGLGSPLITGWRKRAIALAERWSTSRADRVNVLTADDQVYLQAMAPKADVRIVPSFGIGCDLERFNAKNVDHTLVAELKQRLNLNSTHFTYIFIGRQTHFKGIKTVLQAFSSVLQQRPNSRLLLVGEKDRIHRLRLSAHLEKLLLDSDAVIRAGWHEEVQNFLSLAQLNVFPSTREGLPVNLMESLAMGVPVLTINSRGCRDVVRPGVDGEVLKERSAEALARAMLRLQDDSTLLSRYSGNALAGRERFDRKNFYEAQRRIFEDMLGAPV